MPNILILGMVDFPIAAKHWKYDKMPPNGAKRLGRADSTSYSLERRSMQCFASLELSVDQPCWVPREIFFRLFDQSDFNFREVPTVSPAYLQSWFDWHPSQLPAFILPVVHFVNGQTQFINGRHRTAVLIEHMERLPIAIAMPFRMREPDRTELMQYPLNLGDQLQLPDLPIVRDRHEFLFSS